MVKQPAWAAATNSSGLVPFSFSNRVLNEYGVSESTPESLERLPLPARPVPCHIALALRIMCFFLSRRLAAVLVIRRVAPRKSQADFRHLRRDGNHVPSMT